MGKKELIVTGSIGAVGILVLGCSLSWLYLNQRPVQKPTKDSLERTIRYLDPRMFSSFETVRNNAYANVRPTVDDYRVIFPDIAGEIEPAAQAIIDRTDKEWADRSDNYDNNIRFRYTVASIEATPFVMQDEFDRMLYGEMMSMLGEGVRLYEVRVDFDGIGVAEELSFFAYVNKRWVWIGNLREVPDYLRKFR